MKRNELLGLLLQYCIEKNRIDSRIQLETIDTNGCDLLTAAINQSLNIAYSALPQDAPLRQQVEKAFNNVIGEGQIQFIAAKTMYAWVREGDVQVRDATVNICQRLLFEEPLPDIEVNKKDESTTIQAPAKEKENTTWRFMAIALGLMISGYLIWQYIFPTDKAKVLIMVTAWTDKSTMANQAREFAQALEMESNGKLKVMIFYDFHLPYEKGGKVRGKTAFETAYNALLNREIDILYSSAYYNENHPASIFYSAIPGGMQYAAMTKWLGSNFHIHDEKNWGEGYRLWRKVYGDSLIVFPGGNTGGQWGGFFKDSIHTIQDFAGKKVRVGGGFTKMLLESLGATVNRGYGSDILKIMAQGDLDWVEFMNPAEDFKIGMHLFPSTYKYVETNGWHEPNSVLELLVNKQTFNELPSEVQAVFQDKLAIFKDLADVMQEESIQKKDSVLANHIAYKFSPALKKDLYKQMRKVIEKYVQDNRGTSPDLDKLYQSYKANCDCELFRD